MADVEYDIPDAPGGATEGEVAPVTIDATIDGSLFAAVPDMGEPIPMGTYHFRLTKYSAAQTNPSADDLAKGVVPEPYYNLQWSCQQEPYVGRIHFENVPWVRKAVVAAAAAGDSAARQSLNNRLPRAKSIMDAAGFKPVGNFDFETDFLATNPEVKIQLGLEAAKTKDDKGKYVPSGGFRNKTVKYVPLRRG